MIFSHLSIKFIIAVIKKIQVDWEEKQKVFKVHRELKVLAAMKFLKTQAEAVKKLYDSYVEAIINLYNF